jgi:hypothetical protein
MDQRPLAIVLPPAWMSVGRADGAAPRSSVHVSRAPGAIVAGHSSVPGMFARDGEAVTCDGTGRPDASASQSPSSFAQSPSQGSQEMHPPKAAVDALKAMIRCDACGGSAAARRNRAAYRADSAASRAAAHCTTASSDAAGITVPP